MLGHGCLWLLEVLTFGCIVFVGLGDWFHDLRHRVSDRKGITEVRHSTTSLPGHSDTQGPYELRFHGKLPVYSTGGVYGKNKMDDVCTCMILSYVITYDKVHMCRVSLLITRKRQKDKSK